MTFSIFGVLWIRPNAFVSPPQNRHPERSASKTYRVTQRFGAESKTPAVLNLPMLLGAFPPTKLENGICCGTPRQQPLPIQAPVS